MAPLRSEELMLDREAVSRALKAPRAPQLSTGTRQVYRLEDRLPGPGTLGTLAPVSDPRIDAMRLEAMRPTVAPPTGSNRPLLLAFVLVVLTSVTGALLYRDQHPPPPVTPVETTD